MKRTNNIQSMTSMNANNSKTCFDCNNTLVPTVPGEQDHCFRDFHSRLVNRSGYKVEICLDCPTKGIMYSGNTKKRNIDGSPIMPLNKTHYEQIRQDQSMVFFEETIEEFQEKVYEQLYSDGITENCEDFICKFNEVAHNIMLEHMWYYNSDTEQLVYEYGINNAISEFIDEHGSLIMANSAYYKENEYLPCLASFIVEKELNRDYDIYKEWLNDNYPDEE